MKSKLLVSEILGIVLIIVLIFPIGFLMSTAPSNPRQPSPAVVKSKSFKAVQKIHLNSQNTIAFRGQVSATAVAMALDTLSVLTEIRGNQNYPIYIVLDTPGGSVSYGLELASVVESTPNTFFIVFHGYSVGGFMPQFTSKTRYMVYDGTFMVHQPTHTISDATTSQLSEYTRAVGGLEARKAGMVDQLVTIDCDQDLKNSENILNIWDGLQVATMKFSGCPLNRSPIE